jgi:hypothetical protein
LHHGDVVADAGIVHALRDVEGLLIGGSDIVKDLLQGVLSADLKVELSEAGLLGEALRLQVSFTDLGRVLVRAYLVAYLSPEIGNP